jgi:coproporphyrinogen III oxidase-like Fe-S oxidoreductase
VAGERWWNVKHPSAYAARIDAGESPAQDGEVLDEPTRAMERVLLEIRLRDGLPLSLVGADLVDDVVDQGLAERTGDRLVLTRRGRLLGDAVVRELVD